MLPGGGSDLLYFVAYNPYRLPPGSKGNPSLQLVQDAIHFHGARGVKVYPPSGYRPAQNDIPRPPFSLLSRQPRIQYDHRYSRFGANRKEQSRELDEELNRLLEWCIKEDVPVFVHSGYGEFEARKGYGEHHSDPYFWGKFLEAHSKPGQPCRLRLCLGHAGGEDYWFGTGKHSDWGRRAYELCIRYPNVYLEISTSEAMLDPDRQAYFVDHIASLITESCNPSSDKERRYPFSKKILYGTDWFLPDQGRPHAVLQATQQAFLHPKLRSHYADYFSGNARRFMKLNR